MKLYDAVERWTSTATRCIGRISVVCGGTTYVFPASPL